MGEFTAMADGGVERAMSATEANQGDTCSDALAAAGSADLPPLGPEARPVAQSAPEDGGADGDSARRSRSP